MRFPPLFFWNCDTSCFYPGGLMFRSVTGFVRLGPLLRAGKKKQSMVEISPKQCQQRFGKQKMISSHGIPDMAHGRAIAQTQVGPVRLSTVASVGCTRRRNWL
jgi:hypothetical protein